MSGDFQVFDNPQSRCAVALLLDSSGSMAGEPIEELNRGVQTFFEEIRKDDFARFSVEVEMISFGGVAKRVAPFISFAKGSEPQCPELEADGQTPMGAAVEMALNDIEERKKSYKDSGIPYYQPWLVIMSDGQPNDNWTAAAEKAKRLAEARKLIVICVGIGEQVDLDALAKLCPDSRPPKKLSELNFSEFFEWLSQSLGQVSRSSPGDKVHLPPADGWATV